MTLYLVAVASLVAGGIAALAASRRPPLALALGTAAAVAGCAVGLVPSIAALGAAPATLDLPWAVPNGALALGLDPLSAVFATAIFGLGIATAVFGAGYLRADLGRRSLGAFVLCFDLLLAAMALVVVARQALLFLAAWEAMTLSSFFLVAFHDRDPRVRDAARVYLVASHLGAACLFALFLLLGHDAGSLRFDAFATLRAAGTTVPPAVLVVLALVGFGTKAGLVPLHVWLPEAHPAAPSHVSALMSAVLVKLGVYGILRTLGFLPPPPAAWGIALGGIGLAGALAALALAAGQRDLKRVLAYSTVENVGMIVLGIGVGIAGAAAGSPAAAALGFGGALLHVWNHALMKGLAFLSAGAVIHGAGTRDLERMGGLLRRLPWSGAALLLAAVALAALPPLNGFLSEWLVVLGLAEGSRAAQPGLALLALLALASVATVGGLAAVVFTRAAGVALLGAPRSADAAEAHEAGPLLLAPLAGLALLCGAVAVHPGAVLSALVPAVAQVQGAAPGDVAAALGPVASALSGPMRAAAAVLLAIAAILAAASRRALSRREVRAGATWGCGFPPPGPRVQYTAASYAALLLGSTVPRALRPRAALEAPGSGPFPGEARLALDGSDPARMRLFEPVFRAVGARFSRLRRFQQARLNLQLLYTLIAILALSALLLVHRHP